MYSSVLLVKQCTKLSSSSSESSSSDELILGFYDSPEKHVKVTNYFKYSIIPRYSDMDFKSHFRFSKANVEEILTEFHFDPVTSHVGRPPVQPAEAFLMTLWVMGNQECFRTVADRFGFSRGHAHTIFKQTLKKICTFKNKYIYWPEGEELSRTIQDFNKLRQNKSFPNVVGSVDGTHIPIPGPNGDNSFYNRKGFHSIQLQGICNSKMEFIDVYCGWPGSVHDARVWRNSPIYEKLNNNLIPGEFHLLGDSAYPLDNFIMVPFKNNGHLSTQEKKFNKTLSSTRVVIEQAFGRLKGMWRILKYLNTTNLSNVKFTIIGACILHNIGIQKNVDYEPSDTEEEDDEEQILVENIPVTANAKRNHIMSTLH